MRVAVLILGSVLGVTWAIITALGFTAFALSGWRETHMMPITAAAVGMCLLWLCAVAATWNAPLVATAFYAAAGFLGIIMSAVARNLGIAGAVALVLAILSVIARYTSHSSNQSSSSSSPNQSA